MVGHQWRIPFSALVAVLCLSACAAEPAHSQIGDTTQNPPLATAPPVGIAMTPAELADAEPCGLVDVEALSAFGAVTVEQSRSFNECDVKVEKDQYSATIRFEKKLEMTNQASPPVPSDHGGVTVYDYGTPDTSAGCERNISAFEKAIILIWISQTPEQITCEIGDAATDGTLRKLARGGLPSAGLPANSLGKLDACKLIEQGEAERVPGIDRSQSHPAYGGQNCTWGAESITEANLFVHFGREEPPSAADGRETTILGRRAVVKTTPANDNSWLIGPSKASCEVNVVHRPAEPVGAGKVEVMGVSVSGDGPEGSLCPLAIELATAAVGRLPKA
jgi:hypothetical protein